MAPSNPESMVNFDIILEAEKALHDRGQKQFLNDWEELEPELYKYAVRQATRIVACICLNARVHTQSRMKMNHAHIVVAIAKCVHALGLGHAGLWRDVYEGAPTASDEVDLHLADPSVEPIRAEEDPEDLCEGDGGEDAEGDRQ